MCHVFAVEDLHKLHRKRISLNWPTEDSQQLKRRRYTVEKMKKEGNSLCKGKTKVFNSYLNFMSYQLTTLVKTVEGFHASIFIVNYSREQLCLFYNFCFFFNSVFFCNDISHCTENTLSVSVRICSISLTASSAARGLSILFGRSLMRRAAVLRSFQLFSNFAWLTERGLQPWFIRNRQNGAGETHAY